MPDAAVEILLDAAFGTDRHTRTAYRVREGLRPLPALSFAAFDGGRIVGVLQSWPVALERVGGRDPLVMVGPVAVLPDVQFGGIGRAMMDRLVVAADAGADGALMMIGDPEYYDRFWGFSARYTAGWSLPGPFDPRRLLARAANGHAVPAGAGMLTADPSRCPAATGRI